MPTFYLFFGAVPVYGDSTDLFQRPLVDPPLIRAARWNFGNSFSLFIYAKLHIHGYETYTYIYIYICTTNGETIPKEGWRGVLLLRTQIWFAQASRSMKSISNRCFFFLILSGFMFYYLQGIYHEEFFFSLEARDCKCKFQNSMDRISSRVVCWSYMFESHTFREKEDLWYFPTVLIHGLPIFSWCFFR